MKTIKKGIGNNVIAAVRTKEELLSAAASDVRIVFHLSPNIFTLEEDIKILHDKEKLLFLHLDLAEGIGRDKSGIEYIKKLGVDGIISTRGQLIRHAVESGCKKLIVGLGGSCTNDMGAGAAAGAGAKFFDGDGKECVPTGATLDKIADVDLTELKALLDGIEVVAMCDIDNPLYGPTGAAYVFAPQKGADADTVKLLDANLAAAADTVKSRLGIDVANIPGAGAAGGMGAGMVAFFGARLMPGIETVLDTVSFDAIAEDADFIFTGEGKIDSQSLRGKVVIGIAGRAKKLNTPVIAVVGDIGDNMEPAYEMGVSAIFSTNRVAVEFPKAKLRAKSDMSLTMDTVLRALKLGANMK